MLSELLDPRLCLGEIKLQPRIVPLVRLPQKVECRLDYLLDSKFFLLLRSGCLKAQNGGEKVMSNKRSDRESKIDTKMLTSFTITFTLSAIAMNTRGRCVTSLAGDSTQGMIIAQKSTKYCMPRSH